jgi:hypothetical protein
VYLDVLAQLLDLPRSMLFELPIDHALPGARTLDCDGARWRSRPG